MPKPLYRTGVIGRGLALAALVAGSAAIASSAIAGECPANSRGTDVRQPVSLPAKGVTDTVLAKIELANEPIGLKDRDMRVRKLVIEPGGVVPWHSHADRPALIYVIEGEIHEYASNCSAPILHKAGEVARETSVTSHWWKNLGDKTVVLLSFDILHDKHDKHM